MVDINLNNYFYSILGIQDLNITAKKFISRALSIIFIYTFVVMITNTFLILFALEYLSIHELGVILAIQSAIQALTDYPTGTIGDWIGQRWILFIAAFSYAIGFIFLSQAFNFLTIAFSFILIAFARSQESGAFISWLDNNYKLYAVEDTDRRIYSQFFGKFTMFLQIITAVSFILGGIVITFINRQSMFLIQGISLVGVSFIFLIIIRDHKEFRREKPDIRKYYRYLGGGIAAVIKNKTLKLLILGLIISGTGFTIWGGLILFPVYESYAKTDAWTAILRATIFIFSAICTGIAGNLSKRIFNLQKWLSIFVISTDFLFFMGIFTMLILNPIPSKFSIIPFIIVIFTFTVGFSPRYMADVLKPRFYLDVIPDQNRNAIYSLIPTLILIVSIFVFPIASFLIERIGEESMILILAGNGLVGSIIAAYAIYNHKTERILDEEVVELCCPIFPSKMVDTQTIIPLTLPCCWSFNPVIQYIWRQLKEIIFKNQIIMDEELELMDNIMINIKSYGKILEETLKDGIINKEEQIFLENAREKVWLEAYNIAFKSHALEDHIQQILISLKRVLKDLETKRVFRI